MSTGALPLTRPRDADETTVGQPVRCQQFVKSYDRAAGKALDQVDLSVDPGTVTVLLGPSGCGKTTLLRCIAGLETPTAGRLSIGDQDVTGIAAEDRGVAMVFQNYALYPNKTVQANIEFPLRMARVPKAERRERASRIATLLKIDGLLERRPAQLSGGQRQRVGIGRALVRRPSVLLMDEPFSNLDAELRVAMRAELLALQRQLGMTVVFVTHDQVEAMSLADQLVVMRAGRIEQAGTPEEIYGDPATEFVASFVGDMNILPVSLPFTGIEQPGAHSFGIRPENLRLGPGTEPDLRWTGTVLMSELHGRDRMVHIDLAGHRTRMRLPAQAPPTGDIPVHVSRQDIHYFTSDGRRCR
ncbi:ABC transporter ATP-binding protein [Streptomyces sp. NPDC001508]|uniref:ABC transporter ATP-binding protein n=1 Tax=Streptomyces sp. NPDC001508 TaxID=3154656 RepID=UPI003328E9BA